MGEGRPIEDWQEGHVKRLGTSSVKSTPLSMFSIKAHRHSPIMHTTTVAFLWGTAARWLLA